MKKTLAMLSPLFMLGVNAKVNIDFDHFDELKNHPLAGQLM